MNYVLFGALIPTKSGSHRVMAATDMGGYVCALRLAVVGEVIGGDAADVSGVLVDLGLGPAHEGMCRCGEE